MFLRRKIFFVAALVIAVFPVSNIPQTTERPITSTATTGTRPNQSCNCSILKIASDLDVVKAGDIVEFYIDSEDAELLSSPFEWTTSAGEIISGQGTSKIMVKTSEDMLKPKPTPLPSSSDPSGYILVGSRRRLASFTVSVRNRNTESCECPPTQAAMKVGRQSSAANRPANVVGLDLDKSQLILPCKPGQIASVQAGSLDTIVNVSTMAKDPEDDVLTYEYVVSGGKIIGTGTNVKWDLAGVLPGIYSITAGADDGCGICGKKMTREVKVEACTPTASDITCPVLSLALSNTNNKRGEYSVVANISGGSQDQVITYLWSITDGDIVSGQGTPSVGVKPIPNQPGATPIVMLKVKGFPAEGDCLNEASITLPKSS